MSIYQILDFLGTFVFAISGVRLAAEKKMDIFGAIIIGFATAVGGGTIRDLLLGASPVAWIQNPVYLYLIVAAVIIGVFFDRYIFELKNMLLIFDSIGLGVFTLAGMQKAINYGIDIEYAVILGMTTATAGGIIRDILANEIPLILQKEIYAAACLAGALLYLLLDFAGLNFHYSTIITILFIVVLRTLSVKYKLTFPRLKP
ncbi:MAG: trimeric intracellular cation channel family protein [Bacteroidales bacterium]|nr:trimeric intracellular cation channel family protein [Bacteroidales bacterium]